MVPWVTILTLGAAIEAAALTPSAVAAMAIHPIIRERLRRPRKLDIGSPPFGLRCDPVGEVDRFQFGAIRAGTRSASPTRRTAECPRGPPPRPAECIRKRLYEATAAPPSGGAVSGAQSVDLTADPPVTMLATARCQDAGGWGAGPEPSPSEPPSSGLPVPV